MVLAGRGGCGVAGVAAADDDGRPLHHRRGAAVRAPQRPQGCAEEGEEHAGVVRDDGGAEEQHREDGEHRGHACHAHLLVLPHGTGVGRPVPGYRHIVPEGDTVYLAGKRLHAALAGQLLVRGELRHPRLAEHDLAGRTVLGVRSVGKHLLTRFDDGRSLHSHFRMDGSWHLYRPGMAWRRPAYEARAVLATADRVAVGFALHDLELLPTDAEDRVVGHLGPDLLDPEWDDAHAAEALRRFTARRDHELGLVLLEQRVMAGVGNLYKAEVCFLLGLSPWTLVRDVPDPAARRRPVARAAAPQQGPARAVDHRRARPGPAALGVRAGAAALLPVRYPDRGRRAGRRRVRPDRLLVPAVPARAVAGAPARRSGPHRPLPQIESRTPPTPRGWAASTGAISSCRAAAPGA